MANTEFFHPLSLNSNSPNMIICSTSQIKCQVLLMTMVILNLFGKSSAGQSMATVNLTGACSDRYNNDIVVTGSVEGEAFFDGFEIQSNGEDDVFLAKYTEEGKCVWVASAGGKNADYSLAVITDVNSNIYLCGYITGTSYFDEEKVNVGPTSKMFIAKYNSSGEAIWIKTSQQNARSIASSLATDDKGNIYVAGTFSDVVNVSNGQTVNSSGKEDIFVSKLNSKGKEIWTIAIGNTGNEELGAICTDSEQNIVLAGTEEEDGLRKAFLLRLNSSGIKIWKKQFDTRGPNSIGKSVSAFENSVAIAGMSLIDVPENFEAPIRFEPFIVLLDKNGTIKWNKNIPTENSCFLSNIQFNHLGYLNVTGFYNGNLSVDNGITFTNNVDDSYIIQFDQSGNVKWMKNGKSAGRSEAMLTSRVGQQKTLLGGYFETSINLDNVGLDAPKGQAYVYLYLLSNEGDVQWGQPIRMDKGSTSRVKKVNYFAKLLLEEDSDMRFAENRVVKLNGSDGTTVMVTRTDERGDFAFRQIDPKQTYNVDVESEEDPINENLHLATRNGATVSKLNKKADGTPTFEITPQTIDKFKSSRLFETTDYDRTIDEFVQSPEKRISISESVSFDADSLELSDETKETLRFLSKILRKRLDLDLEIISHTDARLNEELSMNESTRMANTIAEYLNRSRKIQSVRLRPIGRGRTEIRNRCAPGVLCTEKEHAYNRRTEFVFIKTN